jgi:Uma2 family endonuclease
MKLATSRRFRWTTRKYFRLSDAGFFGDRHVELVGGEIFVMPAQGTPHMLAISRISRLLLSAFPPNECWVMIQGTLALPPYGAPDPDFHVFDVPEETPASELPTPVLVIEVSEATYRKDSGPKLRTYASANVLDYWIVNLNLRQVEIYRGPENPTGRQRDWRYADKQLALSGQTVSPLARSSLRSRNKIT